MSKAALLLDRIKAHRVQNRLSQKEIRVRFGMSASDFSKLENQKKKKITLEEALDYLSAVKPSLLDVICWLEEAGIHFKELDNYVVPGLVGSVEVRYHRDTANIGMHQKEEPKVA